MALFADQSKEIHHFPTLPAFVCPVEVKDTPQYGPGHKGVFAVEFIPKGTKFWVWTDRVKAIHHDDLEDYIAREFGSDKEAIQTFLRQGFVLPSSDGGNEDDYFYSNPTDAGRFMNHRPTGKANCGPDGAIRDIHPQEEMTMDYSFHGNPQWYREICAKHGVQTEAEIAQQHTPEEDENTAPVEARLQYLKPGSKAQYVASQAGDAKEATHEGEFIGYTVPIINGRPLQNEWTLDKHGFCLVSNVSIVGDFHDDRQIEEIYEKEIVDLLKTHTGADKVHIFDHTRRSSSSEGRTSKKSREPSAIIHNDYSEWSANKRLKEIMGEEFVNNMEEQYSRFSIVNVWRPICSVVEMWPLCLCDSTTLSVENDLVSVPRLSKDGRKGEIQMATYSKNHKWVYFPRMTPKEVILLKTFDSSPDVNRFTIHTAFDVEHSQDAQTRESIETRTFVFYK